MLTRAPAIIAIVALATTTTIQPSKANAPPPPIFVGGTSAGISAGVVGGIFGVGVAFIIYDLYLKSIGAKSWDGTTPPRPRP